MAREKIIVGLDIGTSTIQTIVAKKRKGTRPQVIGIGESGALGIRRGVVVNINEAIKSIKASVMQAERASGVPVSRVYVSLGGSHIQIAPSKGVVAVSRADGEVSEDDVDRVIRAAESISLPANYEILHIIPRRFRLDSQEDIKDPKGMTGIRLETEALVVEAFTPSVKNLTKAVNEAGLKIEELIFSSLAAAESSLSQQQKELGVIGIDIGGGTTGLVVYEEGDLLHAGVIPVGGTHLTNDVAIGLRTSIETAERVKVAAGYAVPEKIGKRDLIDLAKFSKHEEGETQKRYLAEIIEARLSEIFELANKELKKINRLGELPAGAVLLGGSAHLNDIAELAKKRLKLPVITGRPIELDGLGDRLSKPEYATAVGLILIASKHLENEENGFPFRKAPPISGFFRWLKNFLP
ncbi:MAG: cell division protein FtsA [Parcubacteria group bacterium]|nr:cell division protein FtsA [Parcubacteria group bacterium]